jgi:pilus assembly protein FimV
MRPSVVQGALPSGKIWLKKTSLGLGVALAMAMLPSTASALALGKLSTLSHMGERLSVEIDIPEFTPEEIAGLKASLASPDGFAASGVDFNASLAGADVRVQKRADGRPYIKVTTPRVINDPFVNLVLVVNWPSGRIVRDYSLLLDPVEISKSAPTVTTVPTTTATNGPSTPPKAAVSAPPKVAEPKADAPRSERPAAVKTKAKPEQAISATGEIVVASGMTASEIALGNMPEGVSLDQMLVALVKANPSAFINGNVNLVRAGAVISLPDAQQAASQTKGQARQLIVAQSQDFQAYKAKLAGLTPTTETTAANRQSGGQVEAKVTERKPDATTPDKLLLSNADKAKEAKIAKELQAKEDAARMAALSKNISDLNQQLGKTGGANGVAGAGSAAVGQGTLPALAVGSSSNAAASVAEAVVPASGASADAAATASGPVAVATPNPQAVAPTPAEEPGFLDGLADNPLVLPLGAGLIALLGVWAWLRQRSRKKDTGADSSFFESRLQSDSFFGASGGQQVDTVEGEPSSTATYTASQLSEAADVDPIAEADVYLAYGRDIQAEEILKDAMAAQPNRLAIPLKLLELYAKRSDSKAFDKLSSKVKLLTNGTGPEWERARELAKTMNGSNAPMAVPPGTAMGGTFETESNGLSDGTKQTAGSTNPVSAPVPTVRDAASLHSMMADDEPKAVSYEMDFDFSTNADASNNSAKTLTAPTPIKNLNAASNATNANKEAPSGPNIIDFDLSALSLDLNSVNPTVHEAPAGVPVSDPWATKLALAKEFQHIGDHESARKLLQEVSNGANENVKAEARKLLTGMS